jgi:hypothetical protein
MTTHLAKNKCCMDVGDCVNCGSCREESWRSPEGKPACRECMCIMGGAREPLPDYVSYTEIYWHCPNCDHGFTEEIPHDTGTFFATY